MKLKCRFEPEHYHEYPDDWQFGGANGLDPRADPRWRGTTYEYYNAQAERIELTQVPLCDDQAIDEFTRVANLGPGFDPVWLSAKRPGGALEMLPWTYDKKTDEVSPRG